MRPDKHLMDAHPLNGIPDTHIARWIHPFTKFLRIQSASGILLLVCTSIALLLANSPWHSSFADIWETRLRVAIGTVELNKSLRMCINDGLITVFFFVVGLEIKREFAGGELRDPKKAAFPIVAAAGGMITPAGIYLLFQMGRPGQAGWGIPVATDIAFVAGFLTLFGSRVPASLKVLLMSLAIADDIGAILLIALLYSGEISLVALSLAAVGFGVTFAFNRIGVREVRVYIVVGVLIWLCFLQSGVHPTVAGVILGFLTPSRALLGADKGPGTLTRLLDSLVRKSGETAPKHRHRALSQVAAAAREGSSPLERLEVGLHPWVAFGIMPLFALANAGVRIDVASLGSPVALAITTALVLGKPIGIVLFSVVGIRLGIARLPADVSWGMMLGAGCLAGIGFTMSIFIAGLAMQGTLLDDAKIGTIIGSTISAALGCTVLILFLPERPAAKCGGSDQRNAITYTGKPPPPEEVNQARADERWRDDGGQGFSGE